MKKIIALAVLATMAVFPGRASAQMVLPIGNIPPVDVSGPMTWAISGFEIINFRSANGSSNPYMRSAICDARLVEILSRTQDPPLRPRDIRLVNRDGRHYIVVRRYLLTEVKAQDARAAGVSLPTLANQWTSSVRRVLPQIAPTPSRFGI